MKKNVCFLVVSFLLSGIYSVSAQESVDKLPENYQKRHPIYDYSEHELTNTYSLPDFASKENPLKITGTIFLNDGVTPAKDILLFINQPNDKGNYELKTYLKKRYVHHRGWVKTNEDGHYTFYTFIPGKDRHSSAPKSIHVVIKEPNGLEYKTDDFFFESDSRLTRSCRKRLAKKGSNSILKPRMEGAILVATQNIVLETSAR